MNDQVLMEQAIALGERGRYTAPPNPWVGCILSKGKEILAVGHHEKAGLPHAEVNALKAAGDRAQGATCTLTLEPCCHHGRTPPCTEALIAAKVARVVIGTSDPDPRVAGKGAAALRAAGIEVVMDVLKEKVEASLKPYLYHRSHRRPYCILKAAVSLDGKIAAQDGSSQWISTEEARKDSHLLRAASQAILVGSGTALEDNPSLTHRLEGLKAPQPLRVLLDRKGSVPATGKLADCILAPTLVVTSDQAPEKWKKSWEAKGAEVVATEGLNALMDLLASRGVLQLLVEGGSEIIGSFFSAGLVNQLTLYFGPRLIGQTGLPLLPLEFGSLKESPTVQLERVERLGQTIRADYSFCHRAD